MEPTQTRRRNSQSLILPPRQLDAALRKSALRAQRLAKAFDKVVPAEDAPAPRTPSKR